MFSEAGKPQDSSEAQIKDLLRNLQITHPNQVRCSDISYIPLKRSFLYLVAIMDWAMRKVLSWRLSNTMDTRFCKEALDESITKYGPPEIINPDQGSQFTGATWITTLTEADVKISMNGNPPIFNGVRL